METVLLRGTKVRRTFGGLTALNDIDFEVRKGEIVGLLGPNGSGKTTLFNCISGLLPVNGGEITLNSQRINGLRPYQIARRGLSRTFQTLRLYGDLTVTENLLLARQWRGVPFWHMLGGASADVHKRADEMIDLLLLGRVRDNLAKTISLGQQRLLEIGMALMSDPAVVLLDEATSGVNPALIEDIMNAIQRLNRDKGVTFFIIEHNMHFAMTLCTRLYMLDYGQLMAEGTPDEIRQNPTVIEAYFGHDAASQVIRR